jgi:mRNA interferase MazF
MPPTISCEPGDIVLVSVPFTDQSGAKKRPAVVVSSTPYNQQHRDVVILPITSQPTPATRWDIPVPHWREAGLLKPSVGKPVLATVEKTLIVKTLGRLHTEDLSHLQTVMRKILI